MSKKSKKKSHHQAPADTRSTDSSKSARKVKHDWPIIILALVGCVLTLGLTWVKLNQASLPYCDAGSGCDVVQNSRWSMLFGLPIAFWGFLTYLFLTLAAWRSATHAKSWRWVILFATVGLAVSLYLTAVSVLEIKAVCTYCTTSLGIMSVIFILTLVREQRKRFGGWHVGSAFAGLFTAAFLFLHFSGAFDPAAGPEHPYLKALAIHLEESGAKFYGAYWCPHCQLQKSAFGASAKRLPYVECTPGGPKGPRDTDCITAEIAGYPTWIIDRRRIERAITPVQLAKLSGFKTPVGLEPPGIDIEY
ncbi:MAG: vitamin K epoxide reductase family protein [Gammaproteobacteria bacterium]